MYVTLIGRVRDGLVLTASTDGFDDNADPSAHVKIMSQAKLLLRKRANAPERQSVKSSEYVFHILTRDGIASIVVCDEGFTGRLAFAYLDDIHQGFLARYGHEFDAVVRPYHFVDFDTYMTNAKRRVSMNRGRLADVGGELRDVARIMVANIEDVVKRGEALTMIETRSNELMDASHKYRKDAQALARRGYILRITLLGVAFLVIVLILRFTFLV